MLYFVIQMCMNFDPVLLILKQSVGIALKSKIKINIC